jgi:hypothetical protein
MPSIKNLFQTVSDKGNPNIVESEGPFLGRKNPWLGQGYYFWDNLIKRAHWWGDTHCHGQYMICQAYADIDDDKYLDLVGNMEQLNDFEKSYNAINNTYGGKVKTISWVVAKLIRDNNFPYQAMRVRTDYCGGDEKKIQFVTWNAAAISFNPPVQICIYDKSRVKDYHIIYPEEYLMDGVV